MIVKTFMVGEHFQKFLLNESIRPFCILVFVPYSALAYGFYGAY